MEVTKEIQKMHDAQEKMSKATETAKAKLTAEMENNQTLAYRIDKLKETVEEVLTSDNRSYETYKKNLQNLNGDKETSDGEIFHLIGLIKEYETKAGEIKTNIYNLFYQQAHAHIRMRNVTHYYPKEQQLKDDAIADIDDMKKTGKQYIGSASGPEGILGRWRDYAASGHGGNKQLKKLVQGNESYVHNFRYTILQTLPKTITKKEIISFESLYKNKLGSKVFGLNEN